MKLPLEVALFPHMFDTGVRIPSIHGNIMTFLSYKASLQIWSGEFLVFEDSTSREGYNNDMATIHSG
jgi:hypothetical protein